jgi:hypothetical protein
MMEIFDENEEKPDDVQDVADEKIGSVKNNM